MIIKCPVCGENIKYIDKGRSKGGKKSRRKLSTAQAKRMVEIRVAKGKSKISKINQ